MNLNFKQAFQTLLGKDSSFFSNFFFGGQVIDTGAYNRSQLVNAYETGIEVRTVIDRYAAGFASIPIKLVKKDGEAVEKDWRLDLIKNPNILQTQQQFEFEVGLQYGIFNEYFVQGVDMGVALDKGKVKGLNILQGQYVSFKLDDNGNITKYVNSWNNTKGLEPEEVKATIGTVLDPQTTKHATSKLVTASKVIKKLEQAHDNETNSFANNGVGFIVSAKSEDSYTKEQHDNMLERWNDSTKAGSIGATSGAIDVHNVTKSPSDLGVLESSKQGQKALGLVFNMPLALLSEEASTYDNVQGAEKSFALNVLIPDKNLYCEKLTEFLNCEKDGLKFVVDVDRVRQIQKDPKEALDAQELARTSINEKRAAIGLQPLDGAEYDMPVLKINDQLGYAPDFNETDLS
jgi:HK97 family phage portal protein